MFHEGTLNDATMRKEIGERLKNLRKGQKFSQEELAYKLYVDRKSISHYETGQTELPIRLLYRYVKIFGVSADFILFGDDSSMINKKQLIDYIMRN